LPKNWIKSNNLLNDNTRIILKQPQWIYPIDSHRSRIFIPFIRKSNYRNDNFQIINDYNVETIIEKIYPIDSHILYVYVHGYTMSEKEKRKRERGNLNPYRMILPP